MRWLRRGTAAVTAMGLVGWLAVGGRSSAQPAGVPVAVERRVLRTTVVVLGVLGDDGVDVAVPEVDAPRIEPGQTVEVRFDAAPDDVVQGTVGALASRAHTVEGRTLVAADVELDGAPPGGVLPGMTVVVTIVVGVRADVAMVPLAAVRQHSGRATVRLADGAATPVRLGERDGEWVEALDLAVGTVVLAPGPLFPEAPTPEAPEGTDR